MKKNMHEGTWRSCSVEFSVPIGVDPFEWIDDPEYKDLVTIKDGVKTIDLSKRKERTMFSHSAMILAEYKRRNGLFDEIKADLDVSID
jgi:hypothetical protein